MYRIVLLLLCSWNIMTAGAQELRREDFQIIDTYAGELGAMEDLNLGTIVAALGKKCTAEQQLTRELQLTRAFYYWLTHQVSFDCKAFHHPRQHPASASSALMQRKATSEGYAHLFKAMCDLVHINCEVVSGVYRRRLEDIGRFDPESRHYWNIIQIENTKFQIDASLGSGETDEQVKRFTPKYTDAWWLANRLCFTLTHFPDDNTRQLLEIPLTKQEVSQAPLVHARAMVTGVIPVKSLKGILRGREDTSVQVKCNPQRPDMIRSIQLSFDKGPLEKTAFHIDEFGLWITLPYGPEGSHRLEVYVNGDVAFTFRTESRPAPKKAKR